MGIERYLINEMLNFLFDIDILIIRELAKKHKPIGLDENRKRAKEGGQVASKTRKDIEGRLGESVVSSDNDIRLIGE